MIFCCHQNVSNSHCWLWVWITRPTLWNIDCLKHQTSDIRHQTQQMMRMRNVVEQMGVSESQVRRCVGVCATGVGCSLDWRGRSCAWAVRQHSIVVQTPIIQSAHRGPLWNHVGMLACGHVGNTSGQPLGCCSPQHPTAWPEYARLSRLQRRPCGSPCEKLSPKSGPVRIWLNLCTEVQIHSKRGWDKNRSNFKP